MALWRGLPPFIEPIDSYKKDKGGKTKYWRLREIVPSGITSQGTPSFSQFLLWRSTSHFELHNNYWSLTAHLNVIDYFCHTLTMKLHREYSGTSSCIANYHAVSDLFTVQIGIVGESGEVALEKAKPLGRFGFEVYRLIDEAELNSILQSRAPHFLFVEIEKRDIREEKLKAREKEKERKNYRCQRFENALRICNFSLPDPASSNASPPGMRPPAMFPSMLMSSATKETPTYLTPPPLDPSLSKFTPSLPDGPHNHSVPISRYASPPAMGPPAMFPSKSMSSATKETPTYLTPPPLDPSLSKFTPSLPDGPHNHSVPISRYASPPAMGPPAMFPSKSMSSATKETPTYLTPPLDPRLSKLTPSLPDGPHNHSVPISRYASPPAMGPPAMFPSKSMSSATKETPQYVTPPPLDPCLPELTPSLPARPPNPSLDEKARFDETLKALHEKLSFVAAMRPPAMFPSKSVSSATKENPQYVTPPPLYPSLSNSTPSLPARNPNPSLPTNGTESFEDDTLDSDVATLMKYYIPPTTTHGLFPPIPVSSVCKETPPPLQPSLSKSSASLPATPPKPSLPTTKTRKFQMDYKDLLLSGKGSDFTIIVKDKKFHAHKLILGTRSSVFLAMTEPELSITDVDPAIFREFLLYLYTGYEEHLDWKNITELYQLGDKYCVVDLKELCVERMKTNISMENFFELFMLSKQPNNAELSEVTMQFFLENSKEIIESDRYIGFMKDYPDEAYALITASVANK